MLRTFTAVASVWHAGLGFALDDTEVKSLAGTWTIQAATLGGRDHLGDFKGMTLKVDGNKYTVGFGMVKDEGTLTVGATKEHKTIDLKTKPGGLFKGRTMPGIYKFDGDKLVICVNTETQDRPTKYEAPAASPIMLLTFVREKK
ncbi:MAG TPA: TIGR03067 domain-containing protein [Fimbriiglobus sp.]|jgi:uncharacterized protein (TIGR03067 family)